VLKTILAKKLLQLPIWKKKEPDEEREEVAKSPTTALQPSPSLSLYHKAGFSYHLSWKTWQWDQVAAIPPALEPGRAVVLKRYRPHCRPPLGSAGGSDAALPDLSV
jgi:hypothetical protein